MDVTRKRLIDAAQAGAPNPLRPGSYASYKLVTIKRDVVTSSGQVFAEGQIAIADPDTFEMRGDHHRAVYSNASKAHVWLPTKDLQKIE